MTSTVETANEIRPFRVDIPDEALEDLRRRIAATSWPSRSSSPIGPRACSWPRCRRSPATGRDYDWRKCEARLNALPQFTTRSTGSRSTSSTSSRGTRTRCR